MKTGECTGVKGKEAPETRCFALKLGWDALSLIFHFNSQFEICEDTRTIVCNSKASEECGEKHQKLEFPFQQGEETKICVSFEVKEVDSKAV